MRTSTAKAKARAVARSEDRFEAKTKAKAKKDKVPQSPAQRRAASVKTSKKYRRTSKQYAMQVKKRGLLIKSLMRTAENDATAESDAIATRVVQLQADNDALRRYMSLTEGQVRVDQVLERKRQRLYDAMVEMLVPTVRRNSSRL